MAKLQLVLERLNDGSFKYISGPVEEFQELSKMHQYYDLHTTKRGVDVEDCARLCRLMELVALGCEQGVQSSSAHKLRAIELKEFMADRGHKVSFAYLTD